MIRLTPHSKLFVESFLCLLILDVPLRFFQLHGLPQRLQSNLLAVFKESLVIGIAGFDYEFLTRQWTLDVRDNGHEG